MRTCQLNQFGRQTKSEEGFILILSALLMVAILGFVALAIDVARLSSSQSEKLYTADYAALGSLQAYIQSPAGSTHQQRLNNAITRAENVAGLNFSTFDQGSRQANTGELADGTSGNLVAGRFWSSRPTNCSIAGCPCSLPANTYSSGCFQQCDNDGCARPDGSLLNPKLLANSIQMELHTSGVGPIRNMFASMLGANASAVKAKSFAASRPSHGIILLDISPSTVMDGASQPLQQLVDTANAIVDDLLQNGDYENEIGLIAFDNTISPNLTFKLSPVSSGLNPVSNLLKEPVVVGSRLYPRAGAFSDISRAILAASTELHSHPDFSSSFNHIILLSNGLTNCQAVVTPNNVKCQNSRLSNEYSLGEVLDIASDSLRKDRIVLNVSLASKDVAPHSVLIKSPVTGQCMTGSEKRIGNYRDVIVSDSDDTNDTKFGLIGSGTARYFLPNKYLFAAAAVTGGKWAPIRPACACTSVSDDCSTGLPAPQVLADPDLTANYALKNGESTDAEGRKYCGDEGCIKLGSLPFARSRYIDLFDRTSVVLVSPH